MPQNNFDFFTIVSIFIALFALIITLYQYLISKKTMHSEAINEVYKDDLRCREIYDKAMMQIEILNEEIKTLENDPNIKEREFFYESLFNGTFYDELREFAYHYEFISVLIKNKIISFDLAFEIFRFPDPFWKNARCLLKPMREHYVADFWKNTEDLYSRYEKRRKYYKFVNYLKKKFSRIYFTFFFFY
jgi:hypothetical protein